MPPLLERASILDCNDDTVSSNVSDPFCTKDVRYKWMHTSSSKENSWVILWNQRSARNLSMSFGHEEIDIILS